MKKKERTERARGKEGKRNRRRGKEGERFKAARYFIFERKYHDGETRLKIENHDTTSHFEMKRASGVERVCRGLRGEQRKERRGIQRVEESKEDESRKRLVVTQA